MHIFITGAATGIGAATALRAAGMGWRVTAVDVSDCGLARLVESAADSSLIYTAHADTRDPAALEAALAAGTGRHGALGSVFANAGIHRSNTLLDVTDSELHDIIDINIYGTVNTLRCAVPHIIASGGGSVVINCSDQWFVGKAHSFGYGLTKGALGQMTRSLAVDLGPAGVRVNAVCPGTIDTPLVDGVFERLSQSTGRSVEEYRREEDKLFARGRIGTPDEVAALVCFLAGPESAFCTGGHYLIDGGLVAGR